MSKKATKINDSVVIGDNVSEADIVDLIDKNTSLNDESLFYVGIGASAGGLEALRPFVANLPLTSNMTYIIAQHMSPDHRSLMVELLGRETKLCVEPAQDDLLPLANTIYVAPANTDVLVVNGKLRLTKPSNTIGPKPSVDRLFMSLAEDREDKCVAIILSGTGSDGGHGIKAIKAAGGITIAQDPKSAKYDSMPNAAIRIGGADLVFPPSQIAEQLSTIITHPRPSISEDQSENAPTSLRGLISKIAGATGMDFSSYKDATLSRQIARRMATKQLSSLDDYAQFIKKHPSELRELAGNFLICVTSFFRDPAAFDAMRVMLTQLLLTKKPGDSIRIWVPGCATGEEVYSIAIVLFEILGDKISQFKVNIFATDINADTVNIARAGIYSESSLSEVNDEIIAKYFTLENGQYYIDKQLKSLILFARQDLVQDPPFVRLDMISCRNLLIYFKPELQERIMSIFHYSLNKESILFLGKSETVGKQAKLFFEQDRINRLFLKRNTSTPLLGVFSKARINTNSDTGVVSLGNEVENAIPTHVLGTERLFSIYAPPSVLITTEGEIIEVLGDCSIFLSIKKGKANFNIFTLIEPEFRAELRAFTHRVQRDKKSAYGSVVTLVVGQNNMQYRLAVHNAGNLGKADSDLLLVSFESITESKAFNLDFTDVEKTSERIAELEHDLILNRENLQSVIEELETANEELQSLNEESQAANEELQASNEELETANEELQASNEELITVNYELNTRTTDLSKVNNDITNVLNSVSECLLVIDSNLFVTKHNKFALDFFDINPNFNNTIASVKLHYDMPELLRHVQMVLTDGEVINYEFDNDDDKYFVMRLSPYIDSDNRVETVSGVVIQIFDITERKEAEENLRLSASVFDNTSEGIMITDSSNNIIKVNKAFSDLSGYSAEDILGKNPSYMRSGIHTPDFYQVMWEHLIKHGRWSGEITNKKRDGTLFHQHISINTLKNDRDKIINYISVSSDITEIKKNIEVIERQANYDSLTSLPNRNLVKDRLTQLLLSSRRESKMFAVMFIDLDNFKIINDSLGHSVGDELIVCVGNRIKDSIREVDTVGRLGGDEFIILSTGISCSDDASQIALKVLDNIRAPMILGNNNHIKTSASIGLTIYPSDGDTPDSLLKHADSAMYESKRKGGNTFSFFTSRMQDDANKRLWLETELARAVTEKQITIHYQPIIDLASNKVIGAEALARWAHPLHGNISPEVFITAAEKNGLISSITERNVATAMVEFEELNNMFDSSFSISLNFSVAEFVSKSHLTRMLELIKSRNSNAIKSIIIELTESVGFIHNQDNIDFLLSLKNEGCSIALDDFGTGNSALSYIQRVPIDILKIDRSFVSDTAHDVNDMRMVSAIINLAESFGLKTTAEGVETQDQLDFLVESGCNYAQGYFFSPALPFDEFKEFVKSFNAK